MQTIQIENDLYKDIMKYDVDVHTILKEVIARLLNKEERSYLDSKEFREDKNYFQQCLEDIKSGKDEPLDSKTYNQDMDSFVNELRARYGNN